MQKDPKNALQYIIPIQYWIKIWEESQLYLLIFNLCLTYIFNIENIVSISLFIRNLLKGIFFICHFFKIWYTTKIKYSFFFRT